MKLRMAIPVALAGVLAVGCGPGAQSGTRPLSTVRSVVGIPARAAQCSRPVHLGAMVSVAAWQLGAIRFASPRSGVALTASQVPCDRSLGPGQGTEVTFVPQSVRLAVTRDGGRQWVTTGRVLPGTPQSWESGQVAAVSGPDIWVVSDTGALFATRDFGVTWTTQPWPAPVVAAASAGGWLWAASCPGVPDHLCQPVVERMRLSGGNWTRTPLTTRAWASVQLVVVSARAAVVAVAGPHPELATTTDGGAHWSAHATPDGQPFRCGQGTADSFTAAGEDDWWLLCPGGAAAGSSTKALWRSKDAGRTWTLVSAIASLASPRRPGSLPYQDGAVIAAGSADRLWIVTPNTISVSTDGGAFWSTSTLDPQGSLGQFDVLSGTVAWLLAPGAGLWQTTNGVTWRPIGSAGP